ncbi:MAG: hypothetical protein LBN23_02545 [Paludibacter sp.]|jgi:hypothetical protein|nr:hypothetical protein [Paludibacter sp.]
MKKQFLLPHKCKFIGLGVLALGLVMFFFKSDFWEHLLTFDISQNPYFMWAYGGEIENVGTSIVFTYTIQILLIVGGGLLTMFAKEKIEDEYTTSIRLQAIMLSVLVNYIIILLTDIFLYGTAFLYVMTYNFYTVIILYVIIFNVLLFKNSRKGAGNEK